jgi:hypothetical protein
MDDGTARSLIIDRECQLKRGQARVKGGRALESWGGDSGSRQLDYRWRIAKQMILDVVTTRSAEVASA